MENKQNSKIPEDIIINKSYYYELKSQLECSICNDLLKDPQLCIKCESTFCKDCIETWLESNKACPNQCVKVVGQTLVKDVSRLFKGVLNGLKLKCFYGCEVPLLSYRTHVVKCEEDNKEVVCWNCKKAGKNYMLKIKTKEEVIKINKELDSLVLQCEVQNKEINILNEEYEKLKKENKNHKSSIDKSLTKLRAEYQELYNKHHKMINGVEILKDKKNYQEEMLYLIELPIKTTIINPNHPDFKITNGGKTIRKVSGKDSWFGFYCSDKVPMKGVQEFSFRIDHINDYASMMIGFALGGTNHTNGLYATENSWMCYLYGGKFYNAGNDNDYFCCRSMIVRPVQGDIMSICINTRTFVLFVKINGKTLPTELKMNIDEGKKNNLYPCFDLSRLEDQVTLIP